MTISHPWLLGAIVGGAAAASESYRPTLVPRSTTHQGLVTATGTVTGAALGAALGSAAAGIPSGAGAAGRSRSGTVAALGAGVAIAASCWHAARMRAAQRESHAEWGERPQRPIRAAVAGVAGASALVAGAGGVAATVRHSGTALSRRVPGPAAVWTPVAAAGLTAGLRIALAAGYEVVMAKLASDNRAADPVLVDPPANPYVTGCQASPVDYDTLAQEGRRFVHWRVPAAAIADGLGITTAAEPCRVFIGEASAPSVPERVELAMAELDRLGAWERRAILIVSPAGSGYANSVPVEALEYFLHGDVASVCVQYGVLPSLWSGPVRPTAAATFRLLAESIRARLADLEPERRPRIYAFGESLGALTAQQGLLTEPSACDVERGTTRLLSGAVFAGTPGGPSLSRVLLDSPTVTHVDQWQDLPPQAPPGCRFWFLNHDADPVTRFEPSLIWRRPDWIGSGLRNVPPRMRWLPLLTWQMVMFDVAYATQSQSGMFRSVGHDYRADLGPVIAAAFVGADGDAPPDVEDVQRLLAQNEVRRDALLSGS